MSNGTSGTLGNRGHGMRSTARPPRHTSSCLVPPPSSGSEHLDLALTSALETNTYRADGLRNSHEDTDGLVYFIWDGQNVLLEKNSSRVTRAIYTQLPGVWGGAFSFKRGADHYFLLPDLQGHTRHLANAAGAVTHTFIYDAWGREIWPIVTTGLYLRGFGQWGYWRDTATREYVRARHLRVDMGRWVARDPLGFQGGDWDLYRYAAGAPCVRPDPSGLESCPARCGPEIGPSLRRALRGLPAVYARFTVFKRRKLCNHLVFIGSMFDTVQPWNAWDVYELYDATTDDGLLQYFRPDPMRCALRPGCRHTVMTDGKCHPTWAVNYVLFGALFDVCRAAYPPPMTYNGATYNIAQMFSQREMDWMIALFKQLGHLVNPGNYGPNDDVIARAWADAGFNGWARSAAPTPASTANWCDPHCPITGERDPAQAWDYNVQWAQTAIRLHG